MYILAIGSHTHPITNLHFQWFQKGFFFVLYYKIVGSNRVQAANRHIFFLPARHSIQEKKKEREI